jgi:simple sugar transport system ATP-binding protein
MNIQPSLEMKGITKRFPGVLANDRIDLGLYEGEIHALLGENGAGKSTLMNILSGIYTADEGTVEIHGKDVSLGSPKKSVSLGIGMVHQHFKLIDTLTVAENVLLCSNRCRYFLNQKDMNREIRECSEKFNLAVDPEAKIWQLGVGEQQRVEILKQLFCGAEFIILDEPTSVLTPQETAALFKTLRHMILAGKTVLFITHKLYEVMTFSNRITVLRDGRSVGTMETYTVNKDELTRLMIGREIHPQSGTSIFNRDIEENPVLCMENISVMGDRGLPALSGVNLEVNAGEILGIAGVAGNGQRELAELIAGLRKPQSGTITLNGQDITGISPRECIKLGIGFIPEDRMGMGLVGKLDMLDNTLLRAWESPEYVHYGILRKNAIKRRAEEYIKTYEIKTTGLKKPVSLMSGGNLQKLLLAREVSSKPKLLIAAYPVHGVDLGATEIIHRILREQREAGAAIILISEDLEELFEMSNRVAALSSGRVAGIIKVREVSDETYDRVGRLMLAYEHDHERVPESRKSGVKAK